MRSAAETKGVALSVDIAPAVGMLEGDAARLQQVIWNLLSNAIKFTPAGGRVALRAAAEGDRIEISVRDTGHGIPSAFLPHVFERFRQADASMSRSQGGLGLGLSIVHHVVELHGGTIRAESAGLGLGATFIVTMPRQSATAAGEPASDAEGQAAAPSEDGALTGIQVLLVEDDDDAREVMVEALSHEGASVTSAASAAQARAALLVAIPDILVSDIGMPGEDGYALIRSVRLLEAPEGQRLPAIALTGYAGLEDQRLARDAGFDAHVSKPVDFDELMRVVRRLARARLSQYT